MPSLSSSIFFKASGFPSDVEEVSDIFELKLKSYIDICRYLTTSLLVLVSLNFKGLKETEKAQVIRGHSTTRWTKFNKELKVYKISLNFFLTISYLGFIIST